VFWQCPNDGAPVVVASSQSRSARLLLSLAAKRHRHVAWDFNPRRTATIDHQSPQGATAVLSLNRRRSFGAEIMSFLTTTG